MSLQFSLLSSLILCPLLPTCKAKKCSKDTSDIVGITVRNETRKEAGQDPIEEIIEVHMCNGTTHLVDLKEEHLLGDDAVMDEQQEDSSYLKENMTDVRSSERCSYEGSLEDDPDSQVSLSGCPGNDDEDGQMLTLVTAKLKFRSSSYRLVGGKVEMGNGTTTDEVLHRRPKSGPAKEKSGGKRPEISGGELGKPNPKKPIVSDKTTIRGVTTVGDLPETGEEDDSPETGGGQEDSSPETGGGSLVREERSQPQGEELFIVEGEDGSSWLVTTGGQTTEGGDRPENTAELAGSSPESSHEPSVLTPLAMKEEHGEDYQDATPEIDIPSLKEMEYDDFANLHKNTKTHWKKQKKKNKDDLDAILGSGKDILVHDHTVLKKDTDNLPELYKHRTIELCVITDPYLYDLIKELFNLETDKQVNNKIFKVVHKTLLSAETFLKHSSISSKGKGFRFQLNGIRVLKDWGHMDKMKSRKNLQDVLFDLGDYMQVINSDWDGHRLSYDLAVLFTGKMDFKDGDGYAYIGGICQQDSPIALKLRFDRKRVNLNMGRLLAHEVGHALGANHDDDFPACRKGNGLMRSVVSNSMNTWSVCSAKDIDTIVGQRVKETNCLKL